MQNPSWIDVVTAISAIATPVLVLLLTGIGWQIRNRIERRAQLEEQLRQDRVEIYNEVREPFVILLTSDDAWRLDPKNKGRDKNDFAVALMVSIPYRRRAFQLTLMGSDGVVSAYNNLIQFFYIQSEGGTADVGEMVRHLGAFLLEIRRSMGNQETALKEWDMVEWFLKDARRLRGAK